MVRSSDQWTEIRSDQWTAIRCARCSRRGLVPPPLFAIVRVDSDYRDEVAVPIRRTGAREGAITGGNITAVRTSRGDCAPVRSSRQWFTGLLKTETLECENGHKVPLSPKRAFTLVRAARSQGLDEVLLQS